MASEIKACVCVHEYQDMKYGKGQRVHNITVKGKEAKVKRCTVCGKEK